MASEWENFRLCGPSHLTYIDWGNRDHRRSVVASLVKGVKIIQHKREGPHALASPWWDFFHFKLYKILEDDSDHSCFGAIYEYKYPSSYIHYPGQCPPRYVIAFRGTDKNLDTLKQDLKLNLNFILGKLHNRKRCEIATQEVYGMVSYVGAANVWLAGHSLGSAIALVAGRNMVNMGCKLETFLFNPPFVSLPFEKIKHKKLKKGVRFGITLVTGGLAAIKNSLDQSPQNDDTFAQLYTWTPYLFVNPSDPICSEYIGHFETLTTMVRIGAGSFGRLAAKNSMLSMLQEALGGDSKPIHLLPSADLTINMSHSQGFKQSHGIRQWWRPDIDTQHERYQFR